MSSTYRYLLAVFSNVPNLNILNAWSYTPMATWCTKVYFYFLFAVFIKISLFIVWYINSGYEIILRPVQRF